MSDKPRFKAGDRVKINYTSYKSAAADETAATAPIGTVIKVIGADKYGGPSYQIDFGTATPANWCGHGTGIWDEKTLMPR
jgi:hypothetical protein